MLKKILDSSIFKNHIFMATLLFIQTNILFLFYLVYLHREPGVELVILLFSIPPILQMIGLLLIKSNLLKAFYSVLSFISSGSYFVFLVYYMFEPYSSVLSYWLCIILSSIFLIFAFIIASAVFNDSVTVISKKNIWKLISQEIGLFPSGEVLIFLAFFVSIGFLISFSLVFEGRYLATNGELPSLRSDLNLIQAFNYKNKATRSIDDSLASKKWNVLFNIASAKLELSPTSILFENIQEYSSLPIAKYNYSVINNFLHTMNYLKNKYRIRLTLIGHSTNTQSGFSPYNSNYELAQARANSVQTLLLDSLFTPKTRDYFSNIEWVIVPLSESAKKDNDIANRSVDISVKIFPQSLISSDANSEIRLLTLLEHVYFSLYTITTTGYGDIKPSSPFAMFVCSIANLYEIFFLVVFFNVILSPKHRSTKKNRSCYD